jgi:Rieske 2Fe-2S family protein
VDGGAHDHRGDRHDGDLVVLCPGDAIELLPAGVVERTAMKRRNLQMLGTTAPTPPLRTALADGDALRYYPAFDLPERVNLPPPDPIVEEFALQLLIAPRPDGSLTLGDTHVDDHPGAFGSNDDADDQLLVRARALLGDPGLRVRRRWTGSYLSTHGRARLRRHRADARRRSRRRGRRRHGDDCRSGNRRRSARERRAVSTLPPIRPGWSLPAAYYNSTDQFDTDMRRIWGRLWLFAGHSCEVSETGRHFLFDVGNESLIVVRDEAGDLRALHNCCRHRGSRICDQPAGHVRRFVCPYHQWSYGLDGSLHGCGRIDEELDLDRNALSLESARVEEVAGLVFVSFADEPSSFAEAREDLERMLAPQGLDRARVAAVRTYTVDANWKLVWENNRECWHCHAGHREYVRANYDTASDDAHTRAELAGRTDELRRQGLEVDHASVGLATFPSPGRWWSANRTPNVPGYVTESLDGEPVAPPMGSYAGHDVGTLRSRIVPGF